jgi:hypothetical protein
MEHGMFLQSIPAPFHASHFHHLHARYKLRSRSYRSIKTTERKKKKKGKTLAFSFLLEIESISHGVVAIFPVAFGALAIRPAGSHGSDGHGKPVR